MEIGFDQGGTRHILSASCPLRAVRGERILLGMADMDYPEDRSTDPGEAFEAGTTMYDRNAKALSDRFATSEVRVLSAEMDATGAIGIEADERLRFEVVPTSAGRTKAWRLVVDGQSYSYPRPLMLDWRCLTPWRLGPRGRIRIWIEIGIRRDGRVMPGRGTGWGGPCRMARRGSSGSRKGCRELLTSR